MTGNGEPKRDHYGRYLIPDSTGTEKPFSRVTTYVGHLSDKSGLTKWLMRTAALGFGHRPDLLASLVAADAAGDTATANRIVEEAKEAGGGNSAARLGTALHTFTEAVDLGREVDIPEPWATDVAAYSGALVAAGIEILPEYVERVVVIEKYGIAGTFDRIVRLADGRLVVGDLKTGKSANQPASMAEYALQLSAYAQADFIYDFGSGEKMGMPEVDQDTGLIFWLPAESGRCEILEVDLRQAAAMLDLIPTVLAWRKNRGLHRTYDPAVTSGFPPVPDRLAAGGAPSVTSGTPAGPVGTVEAAGLAAARAALADPRTALAASEGLSGVPERVDLSGGVDERLAWLKTAVRYLADNGHLENLAKVWPLGVPTFKQAAAGGVGFLPSQLDSAYAAISELAKTEGLGFEMWENGPYPGDKNAPVLPGDPRLDDLRDRLDKLPADLVAGIVETCREAGLPRLTSSKATLGDLETVAYEIVLAESVVANRRKLASAHIAMFPEGLQVPAMRLAEIDGPEDLTPETMLRIEYLAGCFSLGAIVAGEAEPAGFGSVLVPTDEAVAKLLDDYGTKRELVAAAKPVAGSLGIVKPTNSGHVLQNVVLFCGTYMAGARPDGQAPPSNQSTN